MILPGLALALASCATRGPQTTTVVERRTEPAPAVSAPWTAEELMRSVILYDWLTMTLESFESYVRHHDPEFERQVAWLLLADGSPFAAGDRIRWISRDASGRVYHSVDRWRLAGPDSRTRWGLQQVTGDLEQEWEVTASSSGVPLAVRFRHPESGKVEQREVSFFWGEADAPALKEEALARAEQDWTHVFAAPRVVGEEMVEVAAGTFGAIHLADPERGVDYWLSPEVPGGIVLVKTALPDGGAMRTELSDWRRSDPRAGGLTGAPP
jgi:hypothetical protein